VGEEEIIKYPRIFQFLENFYF
jgi:hypothetical protein